MNISLTEPLKSYVDARIEGGQYGTVSEYVSDLIQQDRRRVGADFDGEIKALTLRLMEAVASDEDVVELTASEIRAGGVVALLRQRSKAA